MILTSRVKYCDGFRMATYYQVIPSFTGGPKPWVSAAQELDGVEWWEAPPETLCLDTMLFLQLCVFAYDMH